VLLATGYALHIRPLTPEYVQVGETLYPTYNEDIVAATAQYTSPLLFWLAALGVVILLWQRHIPYEQVLFLLFTASFAGAFFWKHTTAPLYPVALRRLLPEVLPGLSLLAALALRWLSQRSRWAAASAAALTTVLLMSVSGPYWFYQGATGAFDLLDTLADRIPAGAVVVFEPRGNGAIVGWFAAPLWSFHERDALLLNSGIVDGAVLEDAVCFWQSQGRDVYVVSQHDPFEWWPGEFRGHRESKVTWESSIVGQSRRFPPYVWRFAFTFSIYQWKGLGWEGCSNEDL